MFFLNLSFGEFLTLLTAISGIVTALYLLDRAKRKKVVSTLRFWTAASRADEEQRRKHMREPWSLLLQLLGLFLLLLAVAQLQWGTRESRGRDHVLLLDTSAWTAEHLGKGTLLDREKAFARSYLSRLPARDRVLLVRVNGLASPVTTFTSDRVQLIAGVNGSASEYSALNLEQALSFAGQALNWSGGSRGEVVYIGPRRIAESETVLPNLPGLRTITVKANSRNTGIQRIGVKRSEEDPNTWQAVVTVRNYGTAPEIARLHAQFAGTVFAPRSLNVAAGSQASAEFSFVTNTAGRFIASVDGNDDLPEDDRASVQLPRNGAFSLAVYTSRPDVLKPLFEASRQMNVHFYTPEQFIPKPAADIVVLDGLPALKIPAVPSLWIDPPKQNSPLPVKDRLTDLTIENWPSDSDLGAGLHASERHIPTAEVFQTFDGDIPVATAAQGPVVVARPASREHPRLAAIGFDPLAGQLRYEVATPLLFANLLRWLAPEAFRTVEVIAGQVGASTIAMDPSDRPNQIKVTDERGFPVPFTVRNQTLQLFQARPALVRIASNDRDRVLSLTLPDVAPLEWNPAPTVPEGLPAARAFGATSLDLWQWLAVAGGLVLLAEWLLYGRRRRQILRNSATQAASRPPSQHERELVSR